MGISDGLRKLLRTEINGKLLQEDLKKTLMAKLTIITPEEISDDFRQALLNCVIMGFTKDQLLYLLETIPANKKDGKDEEELKKLEASINTLLRSDPKRKEVEHQMIPLKLKARRWLNKSKARHVEINEVHRNEQINIVAISAGHQILMCDDSMKTNEYYLLVPMQGRKTLAGPTKNRIYKRNQFGLKFEEILYHEWSYDLAAFPCKYVAQTCHVPVLSVDIRYSLTFWQEIEREGFFDFWNPKGGPMLWHEDHKLQYPHIKVLRVFEIDQDLRNQIKYSDGKGRIPYLDKKIIEALAVPILSDEDFELEYQRFLNILQRYHY